MDIENQLLRLKYFDALVTSKRQEMEQLRSGIYRSISFLENNGQSESAETIKVKIIADSDEIAKEIEQLYIEREKLVKTIETLSDPLGVILLRMFYINGWDWQRIRREVPGGKRTLQKIKKRALEELDRQCKKTA